MSNVKIFRLNSGEEILARFSETDTTWTFKDPAILIPMQKGQIGLMPWMMYSKASNGIIIPMQQGQIGLMPWMMYSKASKGVTVPKTFVAFTVDPLDELKSQYDSSLNKGIVTSTGTVSGPSGLKLTV